MIKIPFEAQTEVQSTNKSSSTTTKNKNTSLINNNILKNESNKVSIMFWNLHGFKNLTNLTDDEIQQVKNCAALCLSETWLINKIKSLPKFLDGYTYFDYPAKKNKILGRASGGICILVNPELAKSPTIKEINECFIAIECIIVNIKTLVISVYLKQAIFEESLDNLVSYLKQLDLSTNPIIIGGNFNARIGENNQLDDSLVKDTNFNPIRKASDQVINKYGQMVLEELEKLGLVVLNGRSHSDQGGNMTYFSSIGCSTIDLAWTNSLGLNFLEDFSISCIGMSDHLPISVKIAYESLNYHSTVTATNETFFIRKLDWNPGQKDMYEESMDNIPPPTSGKNVNDERHMINTMNQSLIDTIITTAEALDMYKVIQCTKGRTDKVNKPWYDKDCKAASKYLKRLHHKCSRSKNPELRDTFTETKKEYKKLYKSKKMEYLSEQQLRLSNSKRNPKEFWRTVKRLQPRKRNLRTIPANVLELFYRDI